MREVRPIVLKFVVMALLVCAGKLLVTAQEKTKQQAEWEAKAVAQLPEHERRKYERLKNPAFAQLELLPRLAESSETPEDIPKPYKVGDNIFFRLLITNSSSEKVSFSVADPYYYNRPELLKDGSVVPYRGGLPELLRSKEKRPGDESVRVTTLSSQETSTVVVELNRWYAPLQPGRYMLSMKRRFIWGGEWIESPSISFEVIPK